MDIELFNNITKFLEEQKYPHKLTTEADQKQWDKYTLRFHLKEGLLMKDNQQVVSADQFYPLMYLFHNDPTGGHLSADKILRKLRSRYYWPEMTKDVKAYIQSCHQCQIKQPSVKINQLHPIPPSRLFNR